MFDDQSETANRPAADIPKTHLGGVYVGALRPNAPRVEVVPAP